MAVRWVSGIVLSVAILLFIYWLMGEEAPTIAAFPEELTSEPDALLKGATLQRFTPDGQLKLEISVAKGTYFEDSGLTDLEDLSLTLIGAEEREWHASAKTGNLRDQSQETVITLGGSVEIRHQDQQGEPLQIKSDEMVFLPDQMRIKSNKPVAIEDGYSKIHADSLEIDLNEQVMWLSSNTNSQIEVLVLVDS